MTIVNGAAKVLIWAFFVLIVGHALMFMASKFGIPIKPIYFYSAISLGLVALAVPVGVDLRVLLLEKFFFSLLLIIVLIGIIFYGGENQGSNFGAPLTPPNLRPTGISYAAWPVLNLLAGAGLYLFATSIEFRRTIATAAFVTMLVQIASMEADMWWAGLFGFPNGRSAGLAQNANTAAYLLVALAAMTLKTRLAPYAVIIAVGGILLSQSRSGLIAALILVISFLVGSRGAIVRVIPAFAIGVALIVAGTVYFSPVLNPSPETIANSPPTAEGANARLSLRERMKLRLSEDYSFGMRKEAIGFYLGLVKENPLGLGTGFTNKFEVGPHNTFLKLAVDNGLLAAVLLFAFLSIATKRAFMLGSPMLITLSLTAWIASMFSHTFLVDPIVLPALVGSLGFTKHYPPNSPPLISNADLEPTHAGNR